MAIHHRLRENTNHPGKNPVANMLVLAKMNGNTDLLTVKFETVNKYLAAVRSLVNKLLGIDEGDKFDLAKVATKLDVLHSEENLALLKNRLDKKNTKITGLKAEIRRLQNSDSEQYHIKASTKSEKLTRKQAKLRAELETVAAAADNLALYALRHQKDGGNREAVRTLSNVCERLISILGDSSKN